MPTYQYACTNPETKHEFEVVQSFTDAPVSVCPECGAPVRKVYGSVGVVFKGSGFYRTDSRNSASSSASAKESGNGKESGGGKDSGSKDSGTSAAKDGSTSSSSSSSTGSGSSSSAAPAASTSSSS